MYIWLMRHGKADADNGGKDEDRRLSLRGVTDAAGMAKVIKKHMNARRPVIYASSFARAVDTARAVASELGCLPVKESSDLSTGDLNSFYCRVLRRETENDIICIGHTPYLEAWLHTWTGSVLRFSRAGVALVEYDPYDGPVGKGELIMYVQPAVLSLLRGCF